MFHLISWQTYFIVFACAAGLYYAAMMFLFFRKGLKNKIKRTWSHQASVNENLSKEKFEGNDGMNDYAIYQLLRDDMTAFFEASEPDTFKSDILFSLVSIIKKHPRLQDERFREGLNTEIRRLYLQKYNDGIEEEELSALWQA